MSNFKQGMMNIKEELQKVTWPGKVEIKNATFLVVAFSVALGLYLGAFEFIFNKLISLIKF